MTNEEREELRRFLAEKVMGWQKVCRPTLVYDGIWWWYEGGDYKTGKPIFYFPEWQPDLQIEQAMMALGRKNVLSETCGQNRLWQEYGGDWVIGNKGDDDQGEWYDILGRGQTPAEAICRAVEEAWDAQAWEGGRNDD